MFSEIEFRWRFFRQRWLRDTAHRSLVRQIDRAKSDGINRLDIEATIREERVKLGRYEDEINRMHSE